MSKITGKSLVTNRRRVLTSLGAGVAALAFPTILTPRKTRAAQRIVIRDPGGPFTKAFDDAFYKPFTKETGIEAVGVPGQAEPTAQIKAMVETKSYTWDMADITPAATNLLVAGGYLEKLEMDKEPEVQEIPAQYKSPYMIGAEVYATVLAYRTDVYPAKGPVPDGGWKDLWDVKRIPGRRGVRKSPQDTYEIALLADGVPKDKVYPCDATRALKKLDALKPNVSIWWTSGAQTSQMLKTGELDMCVTWNGRAQAATDEGGPVAISWNQALWSYEGWAILKGGPNVDACRKFIKFALNAQRQAAWTKDMTYGPTNPNAYKYIDPKRAELLPTNPKHMQSMLKIDDDYWGKAKDDEITRFNEWILK